MQVTVRFAGPLRALAAQQSLNISLAAGATLRDLLRALPDLLPVSFAEQVLRPLEAGTAPLTLLLLNSNHLRAPADLQRPLAEGDVVAFVPPIGGG